jgi:hypothetical protein
VLSAINSWSANERGLQNPAQSSEFGVGTLVLAPFSCH